jgi:uncharacterized protein YlzI (FlbEa/FlbD family)
MLLPWDLLRPEDEMKVVELNDAASGELYRVHPDDVSLITVNGTDDTSCVLMLAGRQLVVEGSTAEVLRKISDAVRQL